jgi:uncharacterized protein YajQ (UPF0234 family)
MASESSFDVVSKVDEQELMNAIDQTRREIAGRFDFKNSKTTIEVVKEKITILADDDLKMRNVIDILQSKLVKRGISVKAFDFGKPEPAGGQMLRQVVTVRSGIPKEKSKALIEAVKVSKLKVQAQYQDEQIRISGKNKDDLQKVQQLLRELDYELPLQFTNYR